MSFLVFDTSAVRRQPTCCSWVSRLTPARLPAATQALNTPQLVSQRSAPRSAQGRFLPEFPVHRSTPIASSKFADCPPRGRQ